MLEIIQLRSTTESVELLAEQIKESIREPEKQDEILSIYHRKGLESDLAIHLLRRNVQTDTPSRLSLRLVSALKAYGLVEHTIWKEHEKEK